MVSGLSFSLGLYLLLLLGMVLPNSTTPTPPPAAWPLIWTVARRTDAAPAQCMEQEGLRSDGPPA